MVTQTKIFNKNSEVIRTRPAKSSQASRGVVSDVKPAAASADLKGSYQDPLKGPLIEPLCSLTTVFGV